jgi:hypothetical protein
MNGGYKSSLVATNALSGSLLLSKWEALVFANAPRSVEIGQCGLARHDVDSLFFGIVADWREHKLEDFQNKMKTLRKKSALNVFPYTESWCAAGLCSLLLNEALESNYRSLVLEVIINLAAREKYLLDLLKVDALGIICQVKPRDGLFFGCLASFACSGLECRNRILKFFEVSDFVLVAQSKKTPISTVVCIFQLLLGFVMFPLDDETKRSVYESVLPLLDCCPNDSRLTFLLFLSYLSTEQDFSLSFGTTRLFTFLHDMLSSTTVSILNCTLTIFRNCCSNSNQSDLFTHLVKILRENESPSVIRCAASLLRTIVKQMGDEIIPGIHREISLLLKEKIISGTVDSKICCLQCLLDGWDSEYFADLDFVLSLSDFLYMQNDVLDLCTLVLLKRIFARELMLDPGHPFCSLLKNHGIFDRIGTLRDSSSEEIACAASAIIEEFGIE